jgi:hypothetical protein
MKIIIYKKDKDSTEVKPFLEARVISRTKQNIQLETHTWFGEELGVRYFVHSGDTKAPSDVLVSVGFLPNSEMKAPYKFVGEIDTSIQHTIKDT